MRQGAYTLITGGAGFIGSNLAATLLDLGEPVVILDNLARAGVEANVEWLRARHPELLTVQIGDVTDRKRVAQLVSGARGVYHLAAQVAVTTSVEDPATDLQTNLMGTFNVLEAARNAPVPPPVLYTSTNKVYGALEHVPVTRIGEQYGYADGRQGIGEGEPLDFHSPYGCSKGAADQYVRDYSRIYGLKTVVFRMSCIYGTRQFGTEDQGWVAHFARSLLAGAPITIYGDGFQVRDVLWIDDLVAALTGAMARADQLSGEIFNMGGGWENAVSVRQVIDRLGEITGRSVTVRTAPWRPGDQRIYVSDCSRARQVLGWSASTGWERGLERLVEWLESARLAGPSPLADELAGGTVAGVLA
jgi:CDP-paratose 2-epimerase